MNSFETAVKQLLLRTAHTRASKIVRAPNDTILQSVVAKSGHKLVFASSVPAAAASSRLADDPRRKGSRLGRAHGGRPLQRHEHVPAGRRDAARRRALQRIHTPHHGMSCELTSPHESSYTTPSCHPHIIMSRQLTSHQCVAGARAAP